MLRVWPPLHYEDGEVDSDGIDDDGRGVDGDCCGIDDDVTYRHPGRNHLQR